MFANRERPARGTRGIYRVADAARAQHGDARRALRAGPDLPRRELRVVGVSEVSADAGRAVRRTPTSAASVHPLEPPCADVAASAHAAAAEREILVASPRGFCAGVSYAIEIVDLVLERHGAAGLRAPRDRPQPPRRRQAARAGRDLRRRARRRARRQPADLQRPRRVAGGARGGRARASCASSTPPVRWSPRCTSRRCATRATATRSW